MKFTNDNDISNSISIAKFQFIFARIVNAQHYFTMRILSETEICAAFQ